MNSFPVIGITMGDPSGIGPEIILKALSDSGIYDFCRPVVLGDPVALSMEYKGLDNPPLREIKNPAEAAGIPGQIELVAVSRLKRDSLIPAVPSLKGGRAMVEYIIRAVEMAQREEIAAMVTCPISKALMNEAGYPFEGHTQLISHLTGTDDYIMMLAGESLRVTLVTIHCALRDVPSSIDEDKVFRTISITSRALEEDFGLKRPRIAVAALNPHAGESGLFGSEEKEIIIPAIERARREGIELEGPLPADSLYVKAVKGGFDAVVNMYHDQGLIPLKLLHFSDAVNVTLGLPIIRTSVDHGTAYDIAGRGEADPSSLKAAIKLASSIVESRKKFRVL